MFDKKYIYWGGPNSGKHDVRLNCQINSISSAIIYPDHVWIDYATRNDVIIKVKSQKVYVKKNGKPIYGKEYNIKNNINNINLIPREEDPQISINYRCVKNPEIEKYKHIENKHKDICETLPYVTELVKDIPVLLLNIKTFEYKEIINKILKLENAVHIIPYRKKVTIKSILSKINMYTSYDDNLNYFELYEKNKSKAFNWLDNFIFKQRKIEKLLIDNKIKITYFDLDEYDYSIFDFKDYLKQNLTQPIYDIEDPEIKKRYDKACLIAEEYIKVRNITDTRLSNQFIDDIVV